MSRNVQKFGSVTLARARSSADLKRLLKDPWLKTDTIIIKPNWVGTDRAYGFTESEGLRMLFEALDSKIVVTESYRLVHPPQKKGGMKFTADGEEVHWDWLFAGKGWKWLEKQPNWNWFKEGGHWDRVREYDKWFLDEYGFTDLFNEYNVEYVNVTEEVWQGRTADAQEIKKVVETRFPPVFKQRLYSCIPQKLYESQGATLISFAKLKNPHKDIVSFTLKNFFGLLPDPLGAWWHQWFDRSLIDTIRIYASLFNIYGICEGLRYAVLYYAKYKKTKRRADRIIQDLGVLAYGRHLASVDAVLCSLLGVDPEKISYIKLAQKVFGTYEKRYVEETKAAASDWFPPR